VSFIRFARDRHSFGQGFRSPYIPRGYDVSSIRGGPYDDDDDNDDDGRPQQPRRGQNGFEQ